MSQSKREVDSQIEQIIRLYASRLIRRRNAKQMLIDVCYLTPEEAERRLMNVDQDG